MKLRTTILLIIIAIVVTFLITTNLVGAVSIGEFQQDKDVQIYQTCNNCTSVNFTRVMKLNNQTILKNLIASNDGTYYYYDIEGNNFSDIGEYKYCYSAGNPSTKETGCIDFEITYTGGDITGQMSSIYIISLLFLVFLFAICILGINKLPSKDVVNDDNEILQVNLLKHLRPILWMIAWAIILSMVFVISNMTRAYLPSLMLGNLFFNLFIIMLWLTIPVFILWFIWIFVKIFKDKEMKRLIERGVNIKSTL